ncbi:MAG: electron transport complex subunit RsxE [Lachnospiraceae bacterium]|nr:electron transport complex subunit RsxE [Lachnospiraceae bacterium]
MKENSAVERLYNGLLKENPTFVLMLGMCPTLAVTTSAINGLGMGLTTAVVLALSNMIISLLRKIIPDKVRIPAFIVIIASFVTIVQLLLEAYLPSLNEALGVYIPLIVVNCIILGRAEAYAYFHGPISSLFDGIGMGLGFSMALTCIGAVRELLGTGKIFDMQVMPDNFTPIGIFVLAPGAFFVLAVLTAIQNFIKIRGEKRGKDMSKIGSGCGGDCMHCGEGACADRKEEVKEEATKAEAEPSKEDTEAEAKDAKEDTKAEASDKAVKEADTTEELQAEEIQAEEKELSAEKPEESEKSEVKADEESEKAEEPVKEESSKKADKPAKEKKKSKADKKNKKKPVIEESTEIIDLDEEDE